MSALIGVNEVVQIIGCSKAKAYEIMRNLNKELNTNGYITITGKVSENYLLERLGLKPSSNN